MNFAVAAQTADIPLTTSRMRLMAMARSELAFVFNTTVLGLTINLAAGVLS